MHIKRTSLLLAILLPLSFSCKKDKKDTPEGIDFRQEMRNLVIQISQYAKSTDADFIVIPQNGHELVSDNGEENGNPVMSYLNAIDGAGQEDLYYGYHNDDELTPYSETAWLNAFLGICEQNNVEVLVTDYCSTPTKMDDSYQTNASQSYISFAAPERELNKIPTYPALPYQNNTSNISNLTDAKNFLYLINPGNYANRQSFLSALQQTDYDLIIMDLYFNDIETYTPAEIQSLKTKNNGGSRLVISYMSIGEAEDYRYYWDSNWLNNAPSWLAGENPNWPGNYKVWYWEQEWKNILFGSPNAYLDKIQSKGFDGVYLDIIDAFEYFED